MNEDRFNMELRKFLKEVGVTSQREVERVVREGAGAGGHLRLRMVLTSPGGLPSVTVPTRTPPTSAPRLGTAPNPRRMSADMRSTTSKRRWITTGRPGTCHTK